jgi:DnaJ-class molecular chaperone
VRKFDQFHDEYLRGLLIESTTVHVFLSTEDGKKFDIEVRGVLSLKLDGFREGNIIYEVLVREPEEITLQDMMNFYEFRDAANAIKKLEETRKKDLVILEINPSYGATCIILAASVELLPRHETTDHGVISAGK